jgi:hypothetical protein
MAGVPTSPPGSTACRAEPVRFGPAVVLTKSEVFDLCDLLGRAGGQAWTAGDHELAVAAGGWVGELEDRLTVPPSPPGEQTWGGTAAGTGWGGAGAVSPGAVGPGRTRATAS